jgi:threonine/homoserine/homoserine lactone efflux protein
MELTLERGVGAGLAVAIGATLADTLFGALAALGLAEAASYLSNFSYVLNIAGGLFLIYFGLRAMWVHLEKRQKKVMRMRDMVGIELWTFVFTMLSPLTAITFLAFFKSFGILLLANDIWSLIPLILGFACGSLLWWMFLIGAVVFFNKLFKPIYLIWMSWASGFVILLFGIYEIGKEVWDLIF